MKLTSSPSIYAICRLPADADVPGWARGDFISITRSPEELSVVCEQAYVPGDVKTERDWRVLKVEGPLPFHLTGILASIAVPLAGAKISIFAVSTFDTDYVLVKDKDFEVACSCLKDNGFCWLS